MVIFLVTLVGLALAILISVEFSKIADEKGYDGTKYGWFVFCFSIFGMLMVAALPDRGKSNYSNFSKKSIYSDSHSDYDRPSIANEGQWKCKQCGSVNENYVSTCACGQSKRDN